MQLSQNEQIEFDKNVTLSQSLLYKKNEILVFLSKMQDFFEKYIKMSGFLAIIAIISIFMSEDEDALATSILYLVLFIVSLIIFFTIKAIKNVELKNVQNSLIASFTVIENISTPYLNSYLNNKVIVDFNSINSDGFARIPSILLQAMLDVGVQQQRLEKIKLPQKGITLYKSLTPNIDTSKLVSTTLDIS